MRFSFRISPTTEFSSLGSVLRNRDYSSLPAGNTCIYARSVRKSGRGNSAQTMNQAPPPIPVAKKRNKGCVIALSVVVGLVALLFVLGGVVISLGKKAFEANRPAIIAEAKAAVSAGDYETLEELGRTYSYAEDQELQELIEEGERIKQEQLAERLGSVRPFKIYKKEDSSFGARERLTWRVVVEGPEKPEDYGATLVYAAKKLHTKTKAGTVSLIAEMNPESIENDAAQIVAFANYIPDGKGWSGADKSEVWDVRLPVSVPSPEKVQAHAIYAKNRNEILNAFPDDHFKAGEEFRARIAGEMKITKEEADKLMQFVPPQASGRKYVYQGETLPFSSSKIRKRVSQELAK